MSDPDEWVTIAEAARRIGIDQKQVRRYADKLADTDRTSADVSPVSVRLSAVLSIRSQSVNRQIRHRSPTNRSTDTNRTETGQSADSQQDMSAHGVSETFHALRTQYEHQIADKDADILFLRAELEAGRVERAELRRLLLVEQDANKRLGEVLQLMAGPKIEDPEPTAEDTAPTSPVPTVDVPSSTVANNASAAEVGREPIVEAKRGFWAGLWRTVFEPWRE